MQLFLPVCGAESSATISLDDHFKGKYQESGYSNAPTWTKICGSVAALGGPLLAMWYANRKLAKDKQAREYQLKEASK